MLPTKRRGARHASRWPPSRSSSKTDRTCTRHRRRETKTRYKTGGKPAESRRRQASVGAAQKSSNLARVLRDARKEFQQLFRQRREVRVCRRTARMNDNVPSWSDLLPVQSYDFAQTTPNPVPLHRVSQRPLDAPAEPADGELVGAEENGELAARLAPPFLIDGVVFRAIHKAAGARKAKRRIFKCA